MQKLTRDKDAGASNSWALYALAADKGCMMEIHAQSHEWGQYLSQVFGVEQQSTKKEHKDSKGVWQVSWQLSAESLGQMLLVHGIQRGLLIPPLLAPTQVIVFAVSVS